MPTVRRIRDLFVVSNKTFDVEFVQWVTSAVEAVPKTYADAAKLMEQCASDTEHYRHSYGALWVKGKPETDVPFKITKGIDNDIWMEFGPEGWNAFTACYGVGTDAASFRCDSNITGTLSPNHILMRWEMSEPLVCHVTIDIRNGRLVWRS